MANIVLGGGDIRAALLGGGNIRSALLGGGNIRRSLVFRHQAHAHRAMHVSCFIAHVWVVVIHV